MTISLTNLRRRLVTILAPGGSSTSVVRIASMQTATGLDDAVLDLPAVQAALRAGELEARRDAPTPSAIPVAALQAPRAKKVRNDG